MRRAATPSGGITFPQSDWHGFQPAVVSTPPPTSYTAGGAQQREVALPNGRRVFHSANKWAASTAAKDISVPERDSSGAVVSSPPNHARHHTDDTSSPEARNATVPMSRNSRRSLRILDYATHAPSASLEDLFNQPDKYDSLSPKIASPTGRGEDPRRVGHRTLYNLWSDSFDHDLRLGVTSAASLGELTYCSMIAATSRRGSPSLAGAGGIDALRIAGAALIIDKLLASCRARGEHVVTISSSLLNLLKMELLNGVYCEHSVDVAHMSQAGHHENRKEQQQEEGGTVLQSPLKHQSLRPLTHQKHHQAPSPTLRSQNTLPNLQPSTTSPSYIDMTLAKEKLARLEKQLELLQHKALSERQHDMNSTVLTATRRMMGPAADEGDINHEEDPENSSFNLKRIPQIRTSGGVWDVRSVAQLKGQCKQTNLLVERLVFTAWKNVSKHSARRASAVQAVGMMVASTSRTMVLRVNFRTWMRWTRERRSESNAHQQALDELASALAAKEALLSALQQELRSLRARCEEAEGRLQESGNDMSMSFSKSGNRTPKSSRKRDGRGVTGTAEAIVSEKLKATSDDLLQSPRVNGRPVAQFTLKPVSVTLTPPPAGAAAIGASGGEGSSMTSTMSDDAPLRGVEGVDISTFLVQWINAVVGCTRFANDIRLTTVDGGLVDGTVYVALMCYLFPQANFDDIMDCRTYTRLQYIVQGLEEHGLEPGMITQSDITNASISNWCVIAWLFHHWYNGIRPLLKNYDVSEAFSATSSQAVIGWCVRALSINRMFTQAFATLNLRVTAFVMRMMTRRIRAAYQAEAEGVADKADFVNIKSTSLSDIAGHIDVESEIPQLVHLLNAKYELLHPIYEFYRDLTLESSSSATTPPPPSAG